MLTILIQLPVHLTSITPSESQQNPLPGSSPLRNLRSPPPLLPNQQSKHPLGQNLLIPSTFLAPQLSSKRVDDIQMPLLQCHRLALRNDLLPNESRPMIPVPGFGKGVGELEVQRACAAALLEEGVETFPVGAGPGCGG